MGRGRGCRVRGRGVRRRGGNRSRAITSLSEVKAAKEAEKERKELPKEDFWKHDNHPQPFLHSLVILKSILLLKMELSPETLHHFS